MLQNTFGVFIGSILRMKIMKKVHVQEYRLKFIFQIRQKFLFHSGCQTFFLFPWTTVIDSNANGYFTFWQPKYYSHPSDFFVGSWILE